MQVFEGTVKRQGLEHHQISLVATGLRSATMGHSSLIPEIFDRKSQKVERFPDQFGF
ncbi:uncharacterized protein AFUA_1G11840 [Aspergillus fumigatus Af293]|jgi:hypothetical protein|uniref:Uncharacterized protein n=2 Tax=Aspergillus fumigatus TaxID=746128 RepID=Q4WSS0_ASPFU|nr:hypothetical protein AFUA_1G11840 [Aspergillus fumigatus Af293]EAL90512.1 hypothetical protein AFUA_1G11840 [Aspergillus fumigatus Af293]EDP56418.1 hypothetical protein AFUB_011290 [Aspergillus fumigatus A1163]